MKKIFVLILALSMVFTLCACGSNEKESASEEKPSAAATEEPAPEPTEEPAEDPIKEITLDEKVITDSYELNVYDVQIGSWHKNQDSGKPDSSWANGTPHVMVYATLKNLDKTEVKLTRSVKCTVNYNDGYLYECDLYYPIYQKALYSAALAPLEEDDIKFEIAVPDEVFTNRSVPLVLLFSLWDGTEYQFTFTADNYNEGKVDLLS